MRLPLFTLLTLASALVVDPSARLVCSENDPTDCYPKIFEPTDDWKVIRQGQEIPAGLHVRINMETLQKEAKLNSDDDSNENRQVEQVPAVVYQSNDVSTFDGAVNKIISVAQVSDQKKLLQDTSIDTAAETLVDLSHDLEYGVRLTQDPKIFLSIIEVAEAAGSSLEEKLFRLMGSSLRNNPEAIGNVLKYQKPDFIERLFDILENSSTSEVTRKRVLGIIQALSLNQAFKLEYLTFHGSRGIDRLVAIFPELDHSSQVRVVNLLEDSGLVSDTEKRQEEAPQLEFSSFLQSSLATNKVVAESQFQLYFNKLTELHQQNRDLQPTPNFLQWLAQEANTRVDNIKRLDMSPEDQQFNKNMLAARHEVFGNPNAMRKAYIDEL